MFLKITAREQDSTVMADNNSKGAKGGGKEDADGGSKEQSDKKRRKDGRLYIEKNSLSEQQLLAEREEARIKLERINRLGEATEEDSKCLDFACLLATFLQYITGKAQMFSFF